MSGATVAIGVVFCLLYFRPSRVFSPLRFGAATPSPSFPIPLASVASLAPRLAPPHHGHDRAPAARRTARSLRIIVTPKLLSRTEACALTARLDAYERWLAHMASALRDLEAYIAYEQTLLSLFRCRAATFRL